LYNIILEVPRDEDSPLEEHVAMLSEAIHGFRTKINNLEERHILGTPSEKREKREKLVITNLETIISLEECTKLYVESMGAWTHLNEDMELHTLDHKLQAAQDKV